MIAVSLALVAALWPVGLHAQDGDAAADEDAFDIGIIIDNRPSHQSEAARAEVDALFTMLDRQMFIEHIMVFERPTIDVICDLFGCPERIEPRSSHRPLLWQITRADQTRLVVYYIGEGRLEGIERQLLFRRRDGHIVGLPVGWLHRALEDVSPKSATLMLDAGFAPRRLPCASVDPKLNDEALFRVRRNYQQVARRHWNAIGDNVELAATTPVQVPHCDRFDHMFSGIETPLFTHFILSGIVDGEADEDKDLLVDLGELADYLDERIGRVVRFQWGRRQNVRAIGSRSKPLASVKKREMSAENDRILKRQRQSSEADEPSTDEEALDAPVVGDVQRDELPTDARTAIEPVGCQEDPSAAGCHPCVLDPESSACAERCREELNSDLCAEGLTSGPDPEDEEADVTVDQLDIVPVPVEEQSEPIDVIEERSAACQFAADNIAPFASALADRIGGGTGRSCAWALDRSDPELGPLGQILTPVIWRLGRSYVQDGMSCLLDCDRPLAGMPSSRLEEEEHVAGVSIEAPSERATDADPHGFGPFEPDICDQMHELLPPDAGLPRGNPGVPTVSEPVRPGDRCPSPSPSSLTMPQMHALAVPAGLKPAFDPFTSVRTADERLVRWPALVADVDQPAHAGATPSANAEATIQQADATPSRDPDSKEEEERQVEDAFVATVSKVRWLQRALTLDNRHPGPIDGIMGEKTMEAVRAWRQDNGGENQRGLLTEREFRDIVKAFIRRFGQRLDGDDAF